MKGILANLLIRLGLDSKEFEQGIGKAKNETNSFSSGLKQLGVLAAAAWTAVVASIGVAVNKVINITDTLGTEVQMLVGGIQEATNEFFRSIATADFSNFLENMKSAVKVGREYVRVLDELESKQRALTIAEADARAEIVKLEEDIRNVGLSDEERLAAGARRIQIEEELAKKRTDAAKQQYENELMLAMQASKLGKERIMQIAADFSSEKKIRAERYNELQKELKLLEAQQSKSGAATGVLYPGMTTVGGGQADKIKQVKAELSGFSTDVIQYAGELTNLGNVTDEQMNKVVKSYSELKNAEVSGREGIKRIISTINSITAKAEGQPTNDKAAAIERVVESYEKLASITDMPKFGTEVPDSTTLAQGLPIVYENAIKAEQQKQKEWLENFNSFKEQAAQLAVDFGTDVVYEFGSSLGEMLATGDFPDDFGKNILAAIGGFIAQLGKMLIGLGIASEAFQALLKSAFTNPISAGLAIAAGAALVMLGGAISGAAKAGPTGSTSGSVATPSYSRSTGGGNYNVQNQMNKVVFEIDGVKLKGVIGNVDRKYGLIR